MVKYLFISAFFHLALLAPLYFMRDGEDPILNSASVFVEVKEVQSASTLNHEKGSINSTDSDAGSAPASSPVSSPQGTGQISISPEYPLLSRKLGEEGEATFVLTLDKDGSVMLARLEKSSGFSRLDESARDALMKARFHINEASLEKRYTVVFRLKQK